MNVLFWLAKMRSLILSEIAPILRLAVPIIFGLSTGAIITVTDAIMIAPLGAAPLGAAGLVSAVSTVMLAAIYGLLSVISVRIGTAFGARSGRTVATTLRTGIGVGAVAGMIAALSMSALLPAMPYFGQPPEVIAQMGTYWLLIALFLIPYAVLTVFKSTFEAIERPWTGVVFGAFACVINVPLNYILIHGLGPLPAFGLAGAGLASVLAESVALAAAVAYWRMARSTVRLRIKTAAPATDMLSIMREGAPLGLMYVAETAAIAVATMLIGLSGPIALAANQVAMSVGTLLYMLPLGIAGAVAIRVAQAAGAKRLDRVRAITLAAICVATAWLSASAILLAFKGVAVAQAITSEAPVVELAAALFLVFALSQIMDGLQSTLVGALRGLSDTAAPSIISMVAYWLVALPVGWLLAIPMAMGPQGIWLGFVLALGPASIALGLRFEKLTR